MIPMIQPTAFYIIITLCIGLAANSVDAIGQNVSVITNTLSNEGNSYGDIKKTGSSNNLPVIGSSQTVSVALSTLKQNQTSNNISTLAPGTTVAMSTNSMKPSVPDHSQPPMTKKTVQTTAPHASSLSTHESSTIPALGLTTTENQNNLTRQVSTSISTPVLKPTQTESTVTSRQPTSTGITQPYTGSLYSILTTGTSGTRLHLRKQEIILTICLSTILGVVILTIIMYNVTKCKRRRAQYSHRPLYASSYEEPGGSYNIPDDTLVISGGLYDESRVYNPNMTILEEDDELHSEYPAFSSKYNQFRLELVPEEREVTSQGSSFGTFQPQT
ncbi:sialomucin core protein 24-like [Scyliorhinus canicula]|uniref:sialomucin core protein 24-like n=1 Tax=Scyliorhinus canicula TaxID=7830 RepID=UPI0018F78149|nr:sialomucin core protein 24-like [Scyliorhinus canicula]XP_038676193.1 sialomucin core protein 24-like [Scyliorhinus canicula]